MRLRLARLPRLPRRAKLRTRVLLGVLSVTLVALVAFDVAAVSALRGYLLSQTDQQLRQVLSLYRVLPVHNEVRRLPPNASLPRKSGASPGRRSSGRGPSCRARLGNSTW